MKKQLAMIAVLASVFSVNAFAARDGKTIFNTHCVACHATGLLNAPKAHDQKAWKERLAKVASVPKSMKKTGIEGLLNVAKAGRNAMPPKGTCMDCSDAELTSAIKFMMEKAK